MTDQSGHTYHWTHGADDDPLVVCLHGIGSNADAFTDQQPLAAACHRRLLAWDAPGYRHSPDPQHDPGLDGWADAAAALIEQNSTEGADLIGVSWGGVTATRLALRHPHLVRSLVLADSSVGAGTSPERAAAMRGRATAVTELGVEEFATQRAPSLVHPGAPTSLIGEVAQMMIDAVRMPSYQWACNSMAESDHREPLSTITCPTLVVVGSLDAITGTEAARELADGIPDASYVEIPGAGHLANQEFPERFNEIVASFLNRR